MSFEPVLVTADNFATPTMRAALDDNTQVKVYLFTVQSLLKPTTKKAVKVHKFQEGLGTEFYAHLQAANRLTVFADEHHAYFGPAFSSAVRDLNPWLLLGLTATPDKKTPESQIIYRYPLAAAIADKLVKTPVIVGRKDDRTDPLTKLTDGVTLIQAKAQAVSSYSAATGAERINPVMLVVAQTIEDANDYGEILSSTEFFGGTYADSVLVVTSKSPDESLAALSRIEDQDSPVRIVISVGMLKEGWDVKNVYVIVSMRASVSTILTEQTLGRGMRLPFGKYTGIEILDIVEVVAHERYQELLKNAKILNEAFIDFRTRSVLRVNSQGELVAVTESITVTEQPVVIPESENAPAPVVKNDDPTPVVTPIDERMEQNEDSNLKLKVEIEKVPEAPVIQIPVLKMTVVNSSFSLADITDTDAFRKLGATLAADPDGELNRTLISAKVVTSRDGLKHTELMTYRASDKIKAAPSLLPEADLRLGLTELVLSSSSVPARKGQIKAFQPLLNAFMEGIGENAVRVLSANQDRAGARLVTLVESEQRRYMAKPSYDEVVQLRDFNPIRVSDRPVSADRFGPFSRSVAYQGWQRSTLPLVWFDSAPERAIANMVDGDESVSWWVRLLINDLPILWNSAGRNYNPDLVVIEQDGTHWVVEAKMNKEMSTAEVRQKREAAIRWANHVSADESVPNAWKYLLVSETDILTAKESWSALKQLGS